MVAQSKSLTDYINGQQPTIPLGFFDAFRKNIYDGINQLKESGDAHSTSLHAALQKRIADATVDADIQHPEYAALRQDASAAAVRNGLVKKIASAEGVPQFALRMIGSIPKFVSGGRQQPTFPLAQLTGAPATSFMPGLNAIGGGAGAASGGLLDFLNQDTEK